MGYQRLQLLRCFMADHEERCAEPPIAVCDCGRQVCERHAVVYVPLSYFGCVTCAAAAAMAHQAKRLRPDG